MKSNVKEAGGGGCSHKRTRLEFPCEPGKFSGISPGTQPLFSRLRSPVKTMKSMSKRPHSLENPRQGKFFQEAGNGERVKNCSCRHSVESRKRKWLRTLRSAITRKTLLAATEQIREHANKLAAAVRDSGDVTLLPSDMLPIDAAVRKLSERRRLPKLVFQPQVKAVIRPRQIYTSAYIFIWRRPSPTPG